MSNRMKKIRRGVKERSETASGALYKPKGDLAKVQEFEKWLAGQVKKQSGSIDYWEQYAREAYEKGFERTQVDLNAANVLSSEKLKAAERKALLRRQMRLPTTKEKLKLAATRIFSDLQGVTQAMSTQINRVLVDGLAQQISPREMAKNLVDRVDKIGITRARMIARTEIIRIHADAQIDAFQDAGLEKIGVMVEWHTSSAPCPLCAPMGGTVLTLKEARGLLPRHPNCVCAFIPANVGENTKGQKRGASKVRKARDTSVSRERKKGSLRKKKAQSNWKGASQRIAKKRPRRKK